jgi:uncharacterized membrane protein
MNFIIIAIGIVLFIMILNLRSQVQKIEQAQRGLASSSSGVSSESSALEDEKEKASMNLPIDYIKGQMERGTSPEEIRSSLIANGWALPDVDESFRLVDSPSVLPSQVLSEPEQFEPDPFAKFFAWFKEDWLLKLGALLLLIGFGWLTTYAFLNNWIGPMGRISLGLVAGTLFILLGWWRIRKYLHQGGIFLVLGSTTVLLTIFAAREIYGFFTPTSALLVMFLSTAFVALASVKYNSRTLSLASLALAGIAPILTNAPNPDYLGLFFYLFIVVLGTIWVVVLTGSRELTAAALLLVTLYSLPHILSLVSTDRGVLLIFAYAFATVFFLTNTISILKSKDNNITTDLVTAVGNGLFLLAWIMKVAPTEWQSLIISAWMIVFLVGAFLVFRATRRREPLYIYAGVGVAMLAAATSVELEGAALTIAYTIESGLVSLLAYSILHDIKIAERSTLLLIGPVALSFLSFNSKAWQSGVIHKDFFVLLVLSVTIFGLGLFFLRQARESQDNEDRQYNSILLVAGSIYSYVLLWLSLRAGLPNDNTAVMISLVVFTIIGLASYLYGVANEKNGLRLYGAILVGFVVGRLLLIDVWKMEMSGRIVTFFLVGALLMSTAFLGKKKTILNLPNNN